MARRRRGSEERPKISKDGWAKAKKLITYLRPYQWSFFGGLFFLIIGSGVFMVFPAAAGELIDIAKGESKWGLSLADVGFVLGAILVLQALTSYFRVLLFANVSEKGMADIRKELYNKLITQPTAFFDKNRVGELTSRSTADVQQLQDVISITLAELIRQIIILVVGFAYLAWMAPQLLLVMISTFPVVILVALFFGRYIRKLSSQRQDKLAETSTILEETLQAISVVKAFTNEWFERKRYGQSVTDVVTISLRFARIRGLFIVFIITALFGAMFFVLWWGATMVEAGTMKSGELVTFITLTAIIGAAVASLGDFYTQILRAVGASERIMELLDSESEFVIDKDLPTLELKGNIAFKEVQFNYPSRPELTILNKVNLRIHSGQKIALVGGSGGGKSTIVKLLLRFYDLTDGEITIDGKAISTYNLPQLRQNIAIVPQDVILFGGSIGENIAYGRQQANEQEIIEAAKQANAWEFINSFPDGLETIVGERGVQLSGGQRQRIAIARAILKNPSILLLDEATSALDAESERVVQDALNKLMKGRTAIIIAHRLATVRDVDCIYVLEDGQVVEQGNHDELVANDKGVYTQLAKLQFS
ncbi:ABC transporter ATP-binding protein [Aureispira anguillae]|uniref:ABC transporter transmembrane domain-containing protein n=1 Tax=Aureispira anguillae TaxID=2864201 RepID=A0A916DUP8_9BACT|nr:ABC transporter transmembrane domain-containing protein [Aureispira anguillae]BDS12431.1 ABC transporter transmembrane domain-containing protein [Aureispira anguillae]